MDTVHNVYERAVFDAVRELAVHYPNLRGDEEGLADVACIALNRLPARYVRHDADFWFFQTGAERVAFHRSVQEAVHQAFGFISEHIERA